MTWFVPIIDLIFVIGIDRGRPYELAVDVIENHSTRVKTMGWNHIHAYRYMVKLYPGTMWQK